MSELQDSLILTLLGEARFRQASEFFETTQAAGLSQRCKKGLMRFRLLKSRSFEMKFQTANVGIDASRRCKSWGRHFDKENKWSSSIRYMHY